MLKYIVMISILFSQVAQAKITCEGENKSDWVKTRRASNEDSELFKLGHEQLGGLVSCSGKVTQNFDGQQFGVITFVFKKGKLTVETQPIETAILKLESDGGFPREAEAIAKLKDVTSSIGLKINWSKTNEIEKSKGLEVHRFWHPESGHNAQGFLIYKNKKLMGLGYSLAL